MVGMVAIPTIPTIITIQTIITIITMLKTLDNITLLEFNNLSNSEGIIHFVTGRSGGFSHDPFSSLNTGFHTGDNYQHVLLNRHKLAGVLGIDVTQFVYAKQTHSAHVAIVGRADKGRGSITSENAIADTDALITRHTGICICVQTADCVPLLIYDPKEQVVAAVHAGWRGTLAKVTTNTIGTMEKEHGCNPSDLLVGIGPSNGPCCYEVGEDVKEAACEALGSPEGIILPGAVKGKYIFDQWYANKQQLLECGVREENIEMSGYCSQTHHTLFFSSRVGRGTTGRTTSGIMLRDK
jgi:polyphenol oxidase